MDVVVRRDDLHQVEVRESGPPEVGEGQARLRVDAFALTANNITYAAFGDLMAYWQFFPADEGWGRVPVWGFAEVEVSRVEGLAEGARVFGYLPMSSHLVVTPERISAGGFVDGAAHRAPLPPVYNQYQLVAADPGYDPAHEAEQALLRPLFMTSFLIDDWLADQGDLGAEQVVLASASSKTAIGLAFLLHRRGVRVLGLTSPGNAAFVAGLGPYDHTIAYGSLAAEPADRPTVLVDMAGDAAVLTEVHEHYRDALVHSCRVGATHWQEVGPTPDLPGPTPSMFFAPDHVVKRRNDWGPRGLEERFGGAWLAFVEWVGGWLRVVEARGPEAMVAAYAAVLEGRVRPDEGYLLAP